jgi:hypothetical protein
MCDVKSCNVFLLLFMALWVPISATLFRRAVLMLWHAFLFLGPRFFLFSSFCLVASTAFSCKKLIVFFKAGSKRNSHIERARDSRDSRETRFCTDFRMPLVESALYGYLQIDLYPLPIQE